MHKMLAALTMSTAFLANTALAQEQPPSPRLCDPEFKSGEVIGDKVSILILNAIGANAGRYPQNISTCPVISTFTVGDDTSCETDQNLSNRESATFFIANTYDKKLCTRTIYFDFNNTADGMEVAIAHERETCSDGINRLYQKLARNQVCSMG